MVLLRERLTQALEWRKMWCAGEDSFRWVHGEADGLPGIFADLYGDVLRVRFLHRIRDERKFSGIDELRAQIERDTQRAANYFRHRGVQNMLEIL